MKKIYVRIFLAAVILLPTCFAILSFLNARTAPVQTASVSSLELIAPDGTTLSFDAKKKEDARFIRFFVELNNNAHSVDALPTDLEDASYYKATYVSRSNKRDYRYYFSLTKPSSSYYIDHEGNAFRIDAADTIEFLDSKHSGGLYAYSQPPKLTAGGSSGQTALEPVNTQWSYYTYSNIEQKLTIDAEPSQTLTTSYDDFSLKFATPPDESTLIITDEKGEAIYEGSYSDFIEENHLKKLVRSDTLLHVELTAHWDHEPSPAYGGDATYKFDLALIFDPYAAFWLGEESVEAGDLVVLSGKYVENINEVSVKTTPSIGYQPTFYRDGEYVRALLPIPQTPLEGTSEYSIEISYMGFPQTLTLEVKPTDYADTVKDYRYTGLDTADRTEEALDEFVSFIASLPSEKKALFDGAFLMDMGENRRAEFGNTVSNTDSADDRFISNGLAYVAYYSTETYAVNNGKVIAVGETTYGGNTVVVDHGLGLRSVYYCLGRVAVAVGDEVERGSLIARGACEEGYTDGITAYCELWVGDKPVSYYPLVEGGRTGMIVYGEEIE